MSLIRSLLAEELIEIKKKKKEKWNKIEDKKRDRKKENCYNNEHNENELWKNRDIYTKFF